MVAVWDSTSFWQFEIIFCSMLDNHASVKGQCQYKAYKHDKSNFILRGCYLLSLLRPMLSSVGGFAISVFFFFFFFHFFHFVFQ